MSSGAIKIVLLAFAGILAFRSIVAYVRQSKSSGGRVEHDAIALTDIPNLDDRRPRPTSWSLDLLRSIEWKLFEDVSAAYYKEKGIKAELTKLGADGGIDIKLFQDVSGIPTSIVQCKAWNSKQVGVKQIREFLGVMSHEKIPKGFYMASGVFSADAKEFAKANSITLIDGAMLLSMIQRLPEDSRQRLLALATAGDYTTPSCPSCGVKMVKRSSKKGEFWGCQNFPRCRQMLHVRKDQ
jgi:restriction system protein